MVTNWHLHWAIVVHVDSLHLFPLPELAEPFQGNVVLLVSVSEVSEVSKIIEIKHVSVSAVLGDFNICTLMRLLIRACAFFPVGRCRTRVFHIPFGQGRANWMYEIGLIAAFTLVYRIPSKILAT